MESPSGTVATEFLEPPVTVEGQIALDLDALTERVRVMVSGNRGQREWALARTKLQEASHWVAQARGEFGYHAPPGPFGG